MTARRLYEQALGEAHAVRAKLESAQHARLDAGQVVPAALVQKLHAAKLEVKRLQALLAGARADEAVEVISDPRLTT